MRRLLCLSCAALTTGFLFGLPAAAAVPALPAPAAVRFSAPPVPQKRRYCPRCKAPVKPDALFCGTCGFKLPLSPRQLATAASAARQALERGLYVEAEHRGRKLAAESPKYAPAYALMGNALVEQGKLDAGKTELQIALRLDPRDSLAYTGIGTLYQKQNNKEKARWAFQKAVALNPKDPRPAAKLRTLLAGESAEFPVSAPHLSPQQNTSTTVGSDTTGDLEKNILADVFKVRVSLRNFIRNDSFEATGRGGQAKDWKFTSASTEENREPGKDKDPAPRAANTGKHFVRVAHSMGFIEQKLDRAEIKEGREYALTLYARRETSMAPANARLEVQWKDRDGETLETWFSPEFTPSGESWEACGYLRRAPAKATGYLLKIMVTSPTGDKGLLFDDIGLFDAEAFDPRSASK